MNCKSKVDHRSPKTLNCAHMAPSTRNKDYIGAGPRLSLDQKINFINENNCLAKRITEVGQRHEFLGGKKIGSKHGSTRNIKSQYASGRTRSKSPSYIELPGIDHQVGTLNGD